MPLFTYICDDDHTFEVYVANGRHPQECPTCARPARRLFRSVQVSVMQPYLTRAGDGQLREIRSSSQERALEAAHGIAHLTDSDMKRMRENRFGAKERIMERELAKREPMHVSYARAKAREDTMGTEFKKEQVQKEKMEPVEVIDN